MYQGQALKLPIQLEEESKEGGTIDAEILQNNVLFSQEDMATFNYAGKD